MYNYHKSVTRIVSIFISRHNAARLRRKTQDRIRGKGTNVLYNPLFFRYDNGIIAVIPNTKRKLE
ncbi:MAG: hypothetical protein K0R28_6166 [Paenibacillus sp.]|nr:hypothetical protein [Paenibacillus sp.]